jgi:hypothetical protein
MPRSRTKAPQAPGPVPESKIGCSAALRRRAPSFRHKVSFQGEKAVFARKCFNQDVFVQSSLRTRPGVELDAYRANLDTVGIRLAPFHDLDPVEGRSHPIALGEDFV